MTNEQLHKIGIALMAFGAELAKQFEGDETPIQEMTQKAQDTTAQIVEESKPKEEKKTTKKKSKAKSTATKAKEAASDDGNEAEQTESTEAESFTHDDLRKALVDFAKKNGKAKAYELLGEFGAKKAIEVPIDKLPNVFTRMEAGL